MSLDLIRLRELVALARARNATDLHAGAGDVPRLRIDGRIVRLDVPPVGGDALAAFFAECYAPEHVPPLRFLGSADVAVRTGSGAPYRLHAYQTTDGPRLAFRFLAATIPALETLALPGIVGSFAGRSNGLVLFTGPTGSGKTTALAALIDRINQTSERVVVTVEDPIEYTHVPDRSIVVHSEIGSDVADYAAALRGFMRADPDVILVGEMRDRATMEAVLSAGETGHLVFSTLHTNDAPQTIDRIIDAFPNDAQTQIRTQLAATLLAVVSLRLVPRRNGGRIAAAEILTGTDAVRAMIREGKTHQLRNAIVTGRAAGMQTLETSLSELVVRGTISLDAARVAANRPADVRDAARLAG